MAEESKYLTATSLSFVRHVLDNTVLGTTRKKDQVD
jgi:hypothetical protein